MRLLGVLVASTFLVACGGGSSGKPVVKTEKVWRLVERSAASRSGKVSYKYNGSGLLEKQVFNSKRFEFIYNDQGVLLKKEEYDAMEGGELVKYVMFDEYGEATKKLLKRNGSFEENIVFVNKYPDNLDINDEEERKKIQQYVQRKILISRSGSEVFPYPGSKITSRVRKVTYERIEEFDFTNNNEVITNVFEYPDDRVADKVFHSYYDKYDIRLFGREYDYEEDEDGNLKVSTDKVSGHQVHYTWKPMYIPIK